MTTRPILGIDFSGAARAGDKIWLARAHYEGQTLVFDELQSAAALPGGASERDAALNALTKYIQSFDAPICGFDFPFSLRADEVDAPIWRDWVLQTPARFADADAFRAAYVGAKRETDRCAKTPFAPLNLRLYRQTYCGIAHVLAPLLRANAIALPFDKPRENAPWLLEICPASLLKKHRLYFSYKGKSEAQRFNRERILSECCGRFALEISAAMQQIARENSEGDALDAILSVLCVTRALKANDWAAHSERKNGKGEFIFRSWKLGDRSWEGKNEARKRPYSSNFRLLIPNFCPSHD